MPTAAFRLPTAALAWAAACTIAVIVTAMAPPSAAEDRSIIVQSTTSTANSGLYDHILPLFKDQSGITVNVVAVGTGQAIRNAQNCDGDVLLVHAKAAEETFVEAGYGVERFDLMYNDFIIVGPGADPADIRGSEDVTSALTQIAHAKARFASRSDDSGTHKKEMALWLAAGIDPTGASGDWYRETGSGMGATLNTGIGMHAYILTDRATWISFKNKQQHTIMVEGDDTLFNQYGVILVNPDRCPNTNTKAAQTFITWLTSKEGQEAIQAHKIQNQQLFYPYQGQG